MSALLEVKHADISFGGIHAVKIPSSSGWMK